MVCIIYDKSVPLYEGESQALRELLGQVWRTAGNIIAPLLFVIIVNDMPGKIEDGSSFVHLYADDTAVTATGFSANGGHLS